MRRDMAKAFIVALAAFMLTACNGGAANTGNNSNAFKADMASTGSKSNGKTTVVRKLGYFHSIDVSVPCDVYFTQGKTSRARIVGRAEDIEKLKFTTDASGRLSITGNRLSNNIFNFASCKELKIYLTSFDLVGVNMLGAGDFKTLSAIDTDNLTITMSGAGDIDFEKPVVCDNFSVALRGAGDAEFKSVEALNANVELFGTGDIDVKLRKVEHSDVSLKGTGDVKVSFDRCGAATCTLYGTGDIELKGSVRSIMHKKRGTGDIDMKELNVRK